MDTRQKIVTADEMKHRFGHVLSVKSSLVVARGVFDILVLEHCTRLSEARQSGETLAVVVYADEGPRRPVLDQQARAELTASLEVVDAVVILRETETEQVVKMWNPLKVIDIDNPPLGDLIADVLQLHRFDDTSP